MNYYIKSLLLLIFSLSVSFGQYAGFKNFEIVESVPIETSFDNPDVRNAYEVWLEMINGAKKTLDIEQFYISTEPNEPLEDILRSVIEAGKRGVKVRIVADAGMYKTYPQTLDMLGKQKNISVRLIDYRKISGGVQHSKYFIVDGMEVFLGSQNFDWRALKHIIELGFKITDEKAAKIYTDIFEIDWQLSSPDSNEAKRGVVKNKYSVPLQIVENSDTIKYYPTFSSINHIPDKNLWDETHLINLIDSAKNELFFHVLTYSPISRGKEYYANLDNALRRAAVRGVKVHVMTSDWSKRKPTIDHLKSLAVIPNIEVKMSTIPEWSGGFISHARVDHRKILIIDDDRCWLGTSNWEKSYFYAGRNIGVVVQNLKIVKKLKEIYLKSWNGEYSYNIKPEIEYTPPKIGE
ncbi:MAG: phospholipase D-like domain-containing protein [Bacteroidota bacterium]|nr:phospholipase D-like domain-containing protein [Bacteroidota bacterium]